MGLREFTFAGTASSTYNLFITEAAPYNAPPKAVEMIEIPGRNGAYALDKGNFENVEVTYHVCVYDEDHTDFAAEISDVRNWLCSQVGYQRLEDDYNPNEYRMAIYKSGLETDQQFLNGAEFDITFECKPQRWLKSGETAVTLVSGNDITNPTLFDARPQLQVKGYGTIDVGGSEIEVENVPLGEVLLLNGETYYLAGTNYLPLQFDGNKLNTSDTFVFNCSILVGYKPSATNTTVDDIYEVSKSGVTTSYADHRRLTASFGDITFTKGTSATSTGYVEYTVEVTRNGTSSSTTRTVSLSVSYDGNDTITVSVSGSLTVPATSGGKGVMYSDTFGTSTVSTLGNPMYIDLDIGECWNADSGSPVSVNNAVTLPAELPTLPSGNTTITFDNTFTQVDIVPRWWKV